MESAIPMFKKIIKNLVDVCAEIDLENHAFHAWLKSAKIPTLDEEFQKYYDKEIKTSDRLQALIHHKWSAVADALEHFPDDPTPHNVQEFLDNIRRKAN